VKPSYIDISWPLGPDTPSWPGSPGFTAASHLAIGDGDLANATLLTMDAHTGTHVDAPRHFVAKGADLETLGLDPFVGDVYVVDIGTSRAIGPALLDGLALPDQARRLLLQTANSAESHFRRAPFRQDYAALTPEGAQWVVDKGLVLIGIDYLSIELYGDAPTTHRILLEAGVAILEGLDLADVPPGEYTLVCLPLRLLNAEAAPARAILLPKQGS
jgi:arylformamidase